jgi:mycothiol synthase
VTLPGTALTAQTDGSLAVEAAPSIPGLGFRAYRDERDLPAIVELYNSAIHANGESETWTEATLNHEFANVSHVDPHQDFMFAFVDDRLVAASEIEWADNTAGQRNYRSVGYVHPEWRRRGLGTAMLARNEARLAEIAATHQHSVEPIVMSWLADKNHGGLALFDERGYQRVRVYHHMVRADMKDILVPPLPEGFEIKPLSDADLKPMWDGLIEAFRDHFGGHDGSDASFRRHVGDPNFEKELCVAAFDGEELAGGVQGYIDPDENRIHGYERGWTDPVWVRRPWRRRRLASALLGRALIRLSERGMTSAQLDVDSENPNQALGLYEGHGFVVDYSGSEWHRPLSV